MLYYIIFFIFGIYNLYADLTINAKSYVAYDSNFNMILLQKDKDIKISPASITKLMVLYLAFKAIEEKKINLDTLVNVSYNAYKKGHYSKGVSTIFLKQGDSISVKDLITGIIVSSGNDASIALSEFIGGTEEHFVSLMNNQAKNLGMYNTNFANVDGIDNPNHYSTAYDIFLLSYHLLKDYPQYYSFFSIKEFQFNGINQKNRNYLLDKKILDSIQIDGLKTGHTDLSKYSLAFSAVDENNFRIIGALIGAKSDKDRFKETQKIISYIYTNYHQLKLFANNQIIIKIPILKGSNYYYKIKADKDINVILPKKYDKKDLIVSIIYNEYMIAPIKYQDKIATIKIKTKDEKYNFLIDIYATKDTPQSNKVWLLIKAPFVAIKKFINKY